MSKINAICVYCGSSPGTEPAFIEAAQKFGKILAENGVRLVYGGGSVGLMGALAEAVLEHGGEVTGIIPEFLTKRERPRRLAQELIVTRDMHERKRTMFERADAFVALPGGLGTLEELVEQLTWVQLGRHKKPILIANISRLLGSAVGLDRAHARGEIRAIGAARGFSGRQARRRNFADVARGGEQGRRSGKDDGGAGRAAVTLHSAAPLKNVTASMRLPSGSRMKAA